MRHPYPWKPKNKTARLEKAAIATVGAVVGERHKDKNGRKCIGHPITKTATGYYKPLGISGTSVWVPYPFDMEGRRMIRVKKTHR
jgi:hypothetical protein